MQDEHAIYPKPWKPDAFQVGKVYEWYVGAFFVREECVRRDDQERCFYFRELSRVLDPKHMTWPENGPTAINN
ncbi:MAG: hypothetical protein HYZ49_02575 [Chloroflexi bacterium]|nr:hypothetical protein [Chloroflexota bacterium]